MYFNKVRVAENFSFVLWVLGCQRFSVKWINLAQNMVHQGTRMTTVMNSRDYTICRISSDAQ